MLAEKVQSLASSLRPRPTPAELKAAVGRALPDIKKRALSTERNRRVPQDNVAALREAGLFKTVQPREFGGYEYDFAVLVDLLMDVAGACASTAWTSGLYAAHQWLLAHLPLAVQKELWDEDPDVAICGSYAPAGQIVAAPGGYRLTGRWEFASGCDNAQWAFCAGIVPAQGEGASSGPAFFLVPKTDYELDDTWDVVGLVGTGSKTMVLDNVFVPANRVLPFSWLMGAPPAGAVVYPERGFDIPILSVIPSCLACVAVGAAQGALDDYVEATSRRVTRGAVVGANNRMAEFATVQLRVAEAAASIDAARLVLLRDLEHVTRKFRDTGAIDVEDRITSRRGQSFAVSLAIRAAEALNASTGGYGLDMANTVQRAWRDANAVGRHISLNWDAVGTMYGQMKLGLPPKGQY